MHSIRIIWSVIVLLLSALLLVFGSGCANAPAVPPAKSASTGLTVFEKALADIKNFTGDLESAQGQQFIAAAGSDAIAVSDGGTNVVADVSAIAGSVKAISDLAQLPSVESTTDARVKEVVAAVSSPTSVAANLAPAAANVYKAARTKGASAVTVLTAMSKGFTQAQADATAATAG